MRIATIDVGTNTALLLLADVSNGSVSPIREETRFVRLGEGVDRSRRVGEPALERLRGVLLEYRDLALAAEVDTIVVAGTSASRDAENAQEIIDFVARETGLHYEILAGEDEAIWTFAGAVSAFTDLRGECVTLDIGGGSSELTAGTIEDEGYEVRYRRSLDVGAVRLTERLFTAQPPAQSEVARTAQIIRGHLNEALMPWSEDATLIGVAGTVTSLALLELGLSAWDGLGSTVSLRADVVRGWRKRLARLSYEETLALQPEVMHGRADVFLAGVLILDEVMDHLGAKSCRVSPRDLRYGLALRAVGP